MFKKIEIHIQGITCKSCKTLIETEVNVLQGVKNIEVNHQTGKSIIEFDGQKISQKKIVEVIEKLNYKAITDAQLNRRAYKFPKKFFTAGILLIFFALGYYLIKHLGLFEVMAKLNEQNVSYWLIFLIGVLASFHCVGMCGGLVVAYTSRHHAKEGAKDCAPECAKNSSKKNFSLPHLQYNIGRVISYTLVGGILGGAGSFFGINPTFTGTITLIAGVFMVLMLWVCLCALI